MKSEEAKRILGDRATWELKAMKKALSSFPILNTPEENERLEAVNVTLKEKRLGHQDADKLWIHRGKRWGLNAKPFRMVRRK